VPTHAAVPTGIERTFDEGRFLVSKTDSKGVIQYVNTLFLDISGYREEEVLGQPHNLVRHPEMPRGVFRLLWDRLNAGKEVFAYIVNLAADGAHYWVFAHVTPSFDPTGKLVGFHSNRRCADKSAVTAVRQLYALMLREESQHSRTRDAVEASSAFMGSYLDQHDLSYDEYVWSLAAAGAAR